MTIQGLPQELTPCYLCFLHGANLALVSQVCKAWQAYVDGNVRPQISMLLAEAQVFSRQVPPSPIRECTLLELLAVQALCGYLEDAQATHEQLTDHNLSEEPSYVLALAYQDMARARQLIASIENPCIRAATLFLLASVDPAHDTTEAEASVPGFLETYFPGSLDQMRATTLTTPPQQEPDMLPLVVQQRTGARQLAEPKNRCSALLLLAAKCHTLTGFWLNLRNNLSGQKIIKEENS